MRSSTEISLTIFARAPEPGRVKTRLVPAVGEAGASALHEAFVDDVCALTRPLGARRTLAAAGPIDHPALVRLAAREGIPLVAQGDGDLGARMDRAIGRALDEGARSAFILGSDSPALAPSLIADAFALAEAVDVVLGPADDGGYWTVGARRRVPELFADMAWGTPAVLRATVDRLARSLRSFALAGRAWDVDQPGDLARLVDFLEMNPAAAPASRAALELWYRRGDA
jgi:rSAM/selenodomain-associated transferase 1